MASPATAVFLMCLSAQMGLWLDEDAVITAVIGNVEQPRTLIALLIGQAGAIQAVLLVLQGERALGRARSAFTAHLSWLERVAEGIFSPHAEERSRAGLESQDEVERRLVVYRAATTRAFKLLAVAALLGALALGIMGVALIRLEWTHAMTEFDVASVALSATFGLVAIVAFRGAMRVHKAAAAFWTITPVFFHEKIRERLAYEREQSGLGSSAVDCNGAHGRGVARVS